MCLQAVHKDRACPLWCHLCRGKELVLQNPIILQVCWEQVECCHQRIFPCIIHRWLGWHKAFLMLHGTCLLNKGQFPEVECRIQPFPELVLAYQKKMLQTLYKPLKLGFKILGHKNQVPLEVQVSLEPAARCPGPLAAWRGEEAMAILCDSWNLRRMASWRFRWWVEGGNWYIGSPILL